MLRVWVTGSFNENMITILYQTAQPDQVQTYSDSNMWLEIFDKQKQNCDSVCKIQVILAGNRNIAPRAALPIPTSVCSIVCLSLFGIFMCTQMVMHAIACRGCMTL